MPEITEATAHVLEMLRVNSGVAVTQDGESWAPVYLDDAKPRGWSKQQFAGHLSDLKAAGLYRPTRISNLGSVRLED
jgi:hypothetical protein